MTKRKPKVYVPNRSNHDFSDALRFGQLIFLTEGMVKKLHVNHLYRQCIDGMRDARETDYVLISSLSIINAVVASIMAYRFGRINYLIYSNGSYVLREVVLGDDHSGENVRNSDT